MQCSVHECLLLLLLDLVVEAGPVDSLLDHVSLQLFDLRSHQLHTGLDLLGLLFKVSILLPHALHISLVLFNVLLSLGDVAVVSLLRIQAFKFRLLLSYDLFKLLQLHLRERLLLELGQATLQLIELLLEASLLTEKVTVNALCLLKVL